MRGVLPSMQQCATVCLRADAGILDDLLKSTRIPEHTASIFCYLASLVRHEANTNWVLDFKQYCY